jgi:hypothetical protein
LRGERLHHGQSVTLADGTAENATIPSCRTPNGWDWVQV